MPAAGINISSNTKGLGAALTNPTHLAKRKGNLQQDYPVYFRGQDFTDAETAFWTHGRRLEFAQQETLCVEIIAAKLSQHPTLMPAIGSRGGVAWLERCGHRTGAQTATFKRWEGQGRGSAFIRALILAYERVLSALTAPVQTPSQPTMV